MCMKKKCFERNKSLQKHLSHFSELLWAMPPDLPDSDFSFTPQDRWGTLRNREDAHPPLQTQEIL